MQPCPGNLVTIGPAVLFYAWAHALNAIWAPFLIQAWIWQSNQQTITFETSEGSENTWLQNQLKVLSYPLVTSRFDYCNGLLCGIPEELICKFQRVQNNGARVVTLTKKLDHITPALKELHWLPVRKRIEFKILLLAYMYLHGTAPFYLREWWKSMSHHGHWDQHPRTYSASQEPTWKPIRCLCPKTMESATK